MGGPKDRCESLSFQAQVLPLPIWGSEREGTEFGVEGPGVGLLETLGEGCGAHFLPLPRKRSVPSTAPCSQAPLPPRACARLSWDLCAGELPGTTPPAAPRAVIALAPRSLGFQSSLEPEPDLHPRADH